MREREVGWLISMELISPRDEFQPNYYYYFLNNMREREVGWLISMELVFSRDEFQPDYYYYFFK
jgi:hypothetical protein